MAKVKQKEKPQKNKESEKYANLSDKEAYEKRKKVRGKIKSILDKDVTKDPIKLFRMRRLQRSLGIMKLNKHRSAYFELQEVPASTRRSNRHPDVRSKRGTNKIRPKRKRV